MSMQIKSKCASKRITSFSQPNNLKIYGEQRSKRNFTDEDLFPLTQPSPSGIKFKRNSSTIIEILDKKTKGNTTHDDLTNVNLTDKLPHDLIYVIMLPYILDKNFKALNQPILMKIHVSKLSDFGLQLPFDEFNNVRENCFLIELSGHSLHATIIAIGDSPLDVGCSLKDNMTKNSSRGVLKKMMSFCDDVSEIAHVPLDSDEDLPPQKVLSDKSIAKIFGSEIIQSNESHLYISSLEQTKDGNLNIHNTKQKETENIRDGYNESRINSKRERQSLKIMKETHEPDSISSDLSVSEIALKNIQQKLKNLEQEKSSLSSKDTTGGILLTLIDVVNDLTDIFIHKKIKDDEFANLVPESDKTYKIKQKNQIFIEGSIQLDLDAYTFAVKNSKRGDASSYAYQLIMCFPKNYYKGVTLGKRFIDKKTIESFLDNEQNGTTKDVSIKYPLSLIFGFKDPFNERMVGKFDYNLGQERVKSLIHHIFRKADIYKYSSSLEKKVRARIIKVLSARNSKFLKGKEIEINDSDSYESAESRNQDSFSKTWDPDCFS